MLDLGGGVKSVGFQGSRETDSERKSETDDEYVVWGFGVWGLGFGVWDVKFGVWG